MKLECDLKKFNQNQLLILADTIALLATQISTFNSVPELHGCVDTDTGAVFLIDGNGNTWDHNLRPVKLNDMSLY